MITLAANQLSFEPQYGVRRDDQVIFVFFFFRLVALQMRVVAFATRQDEKYTKGVMLDMEYDPQPPYKAGSVRNTDKIVVDMMLEMYDMGLQPLIKSRG